MLANRRSVVRFAAIALLAAPLAGQALAAEPAADLVSSTFTDGVNVIKTTDAAGRRAAFQSLLTSRFDLPYMAQTALGKYWSSANPEQQTRFIKATAAAEARAYADRFSQYGGQTLTVAKVTPKASGTFAVDTRVNQSGGQPIKIEWEVRQAPEGLRISDVKVEGVRMVLTRRSDFKSYIQQHGGQVQALIDEMEARAAR